MKTIRTIFWLTICPAYMALAESVTLAWDANPEPDISYRVSYGITSGVRPNIVEAGRALEVEVVDLTAGAPYFFAVQAVGPDGLTSLPSAEITHTIPLPSIKGWTVEYVDDEQADGYSAELTIDGDPNTFWHTTWKEGLTAKPMPHEIRIDMGSAKTLSAITCLPRQDEFDGSNVRAYEIYLSLDGVNWNLTTTGEINQGKQRATLSFPAQSARYFKFVVRSSQDGKQAASIAELDVIEALPPVVPSVPKNLRVVEIQTSSNLTDWETIAYLPQTKPTEFVRARVATVTLTPTP